MRTARLCSLALVACSRTALDGAITNDPPARCHDFRVPAAAACGPASTATVLFDESVAQINGFAIDDANVYWTDRIDNTDIVETLHVMSKCGGPASTLASDITGPLVVRGGFVFGHGSDGFVRVPVAGGAVEHLGSPDVATMQFAVDDTTLFTTKQDVNGANLVAYSIADRTTTALAPSADRYFATIAVDCATAFFTVGTDYRTHLVSIPKGGGTTTILTSVTFDPVNGLKLPGPIVIDDDFLYWVRLDGVLFRVKKDGTEATSIANGVPTLIAVDDQYVYFPFQHLLERIPKSGGPMGSLASADDVQAIAVDLSSVFWVENGAVEGYRVMTQEK